MRESDERVRKRSFCWMSDTVGGRERPAALEHCLRSQYKSQTNDVSPPLSRASLALVAFMSGQKN